MQSDEHMVARSGSAKTATLTMLLHRAWSTSWMARRGTDVAIRLGAALVPPGRSVASSVERSCGVLSESGSSSSSSDALSSDCACEEMRGGGEESRDEDRETNGGVEGGKGRERAAFWRGEESREQRAESSHDWAEAAAACARACVRGANGRRACDGAARCPGLSLTLLDLRVHHHRAARPPVVHATTAQTVAGARQRRDVQLLEDAREGVRAQHDRRACKAGSDAAGSDATPVGFNAATQRRCALVGFWLQGPP